MDYSGNMLKWVKLISHLDKLKAAEFCLGAKLPLALRVCIIQLSWKLFGELVLTNLLRFIPQTGCLGCSGERSKSQRVFQTRESDHN